MFAVQSGGRCAWASRSTTTVLGTLAVVLPLRAEQPTTHPSPENVELLVKRLGDASYDARTEATRQLCRLGAAARPALQQAVAGTDAEVALRARAILKVLDELYFSGCKIELAVSRERIAWNESLDLRVTVQNESAFPSNVPFEPADKLRDRVTPLASQVCGVLDIADFLVVTGPDGPIQLHVDSLTEDPAVDAVVRERAETSPSAVLPPGGRIEWAASDFNRGWARYAMLRPGRYTVRLQYQPDWDEEEFLRQEIGFVASNSVEVIVAEGAPSAIEGPWAPARLVLTHADGMLSANIHNPSDVEVWVNTNFSPGGPPFAALRWTVWAREDWRDTPAEGGSGASGGFSRERLVRLAAGETHGVGRAEVARLRAGAGLQPGEPLFVRAVYSNFCDRSWQREQKAAPPDGLGEPLPPRVVATTLVAEPLRID